MINKQHLEARKSAARLAAAERALLAQVSFEPSCAYTAVIAFCGRQLQGHPGVVSMYWAFQTPRELCVVMELLRGGDFFFHLLKLAMLPEVAQC